MKYLISNGLMLFLCISCSHLTPTVYEISKPSEVSNKDEKIELAAPQTICIEVKRDERALDFAHRLEQNKITTIQALYRQAARLPFSSYAFYARKKHAPTQSLLLLEGLLTPGKYELPVKPIIDYPEVYAASLAEYNARYILNYLLEVSRYRYRELKLNNGLTPYEQIILASLVEKEAVANQDYSLVASVFYNRLKNKINLASCPALEYALGYHRPFLTKIDILFNSPFNLYRKAGLPPAPICFISDEALAAVTQPDTSPYFFFVYDWVTCKLNFAKDYRTHLENARQARSHYLQKYGSTEIYKIFPGLYYEPIDKNN